MHLISTVPVDELLDDHATEFEECRRWASSDAGQIARAQNPAGFANVRAHAGRTCHGRGAQTGDGRDGVRAGSGARPRLRPARRLLNRPLFRPKSDSAGGADLRA